MYYILVKHGSYLLHENDQFTTLIVQFHYARATLLEIW